MQAFLPIFLISPHPVWHRPQRRYGGNGHRTCTRWSHLGPTLMIHPGYITRVGDSDRYISTYMKTTLNPDHIPSIVDPSANSVLSPHIFPANQSPMLALACPPAMRDISPNTCHALFFSSYMQLFNTRRIDLLMYFVRIQCTVPRQPLAVQ